MYNHTIIVIQLLLRGGSTQWIPSKRETADGAAADVGGIHWHHFEKTRGSVETHVIVRFGVQALRFMVEGLVRFRL